MELKDFENIKVNRTLSSISTWTRRGFVIVLILLIGALFVSNLILARKVNKIEQGTNTQILAIKQEVATTTEMRLEAVKREAFKRDSNLVALIGKLQINVKDLNTVIQLTTKSTKKFEKQIGTINGQIQNTQKLLMKIDSTLQASGDTLDVGVLEPILNDVPCNPIGIYHFWDYGSNFKWDAYLNFDQDTFFLTPRYESVLTLLTTKVHSGFLGLKRPTFKVTVASDDPYATYTISGATLIPPQPILSVGVGVGYGMTYSNNNFFFGPNLSLSVYRNLFSIYKK